jgi:hypothetical protein
LPLLPAGALDKANNQKDQAEECQKETAQEPCYANAELSKTWEGSNGVLALTELTPCAHNVVGGTGVCIE